MYCIYKMKKYHLVQFIYIFINYIMFRCNRPHDLQGIRGWF